MGNNRSRCFPLGTRKLDVVLESSPDRVSCFRVRDVRLEAGSPNVSQPPTTSSFTGTTRRKAVIWKLNFGALEKNDIKCVVCVRCKGVLHKNKQVRVTCFQGKNASSRVSVETGNYLKLRFMCFVLNWVSGNCEMNAVVSCPMSWRRREPLSPQHGSRGPPCPQDFLKIMQFLGNFKGKPPILSTFWAQGPPWGQNSTGPP